MQSRRDLWSILKDTLGEISWLAEHENGIKNLFPAEWTHVLEFGQVGAMRVGFHLKLVGVDWRDQEEFGRIMVYLERVKLIERENLMIRRNPSNVFTKPPICLPSLN